MSDAEGGLRGLLFVPHHLLTYCIRFRINILCSKMMLIELRIAVASVDYQRCHARDIDCSARRHVLPCTVEERDQRGDAMYARYEPEVISVD